MGELKILLWPSTCWGNMSWSTLSFPSPLFSGSNDCKASATTSRHYDVMFPWRHHWPFQVFYKAYFVQITLGSSCTKWIAVENGFHYILSSVQTLKMAINRLWNYFGPLISIKTRPQVEENLKWVEENLYKAFSLSSSIWVNLNQIEFEEILKLKYLYTIKAWTWNGMRWVYEMKIRILMINKKNWMNLLHGTSGG